MDNTIDVCFTFDTTGSMYPCLTQLRRYLSETCEQLFKDIPDLRIAFIAHGDYDDAPYTYVTKVFNFSRDKNKIVNFVRTVGPTDGYDRPECYELVLHKARTELDWRSGRSKVLVMIGDDVPHGPDYRKNRDRIDWRNELGLLLEAQINVYGVHCMPGTRWHSKPFYTEIAKKTGGFYLTLDQFSYIRDLVMSICYKQESPEALDRFVDEIKVQGRMNRNLAFSISVMTGEATYSEEEEVYEAPTYKRPPRTRKYAFEKDGLIPVPSGRFQVLPVDDECTIKNFIAEQGVSYEKGRGFYELIRHGRKRYKVQPYKEIILMDRESGDLFTGAEPRKMLGLRPFMARSDYKGEVYDTLPPNQLPNYRVFIQSTSYTRKLVPGSSLLYEVEDWKY